MSSIQTLVSSWEIRNAFLQKALIDHRPTYKYYKTAIEIELKYMVDGDFLQWLYRGNCRHNNCCNSLRRMLQKKEIEAVSRKSADGTSVLFCMGLLVVLNELECTSTIQ